MPTATVLQNPPQSGTEARIGGRTKAGKAAPWLLPVIVLVALALRLAVVPFNNFEGLMNPDHLHAWEPGNVAESLVAGRGFGSPFSSTQLSAVMPPVYPLLIAVIFRCFGIHTWASIFVTHALNCLLSALACIPLFLTARRSFGERAARWAAWGWAFSPYGIYFAAAWAWSTHLSLLCLCWLLYLAQDLERTPRLALWAGFGLLAGFAGLNEPSVLVVVPFLLMLACWRLARSGYKWLLPGVVASLTLAATISPWMIRNAVTFHRFIPMRDSMGLELWMGNNGYSVRWTSDRLHPLHDQEELADYNRMGELAYMDRKASQAEAFISEHREWFIWMCMRRAVYLWTGYWSLSREYLELEPMDPANIPFATALTLLAIAGLAMAWRERPFEVLRYGGVLFLFPMIYYFSHPEPYHMRPLDPVLVMLGCHALLTWRARVGESASVVVAEPAVQEA
ncbi:MAG TPA: glycosyltransferase family 39 protein [Terracidiphilus sp.]|jgi:4-amino-4-deoxy-L-arabinose transferase-like glycosyltransferase